MTCGPLTRMPNTWKKLQEGNSRIPIFAQEGMRFAVFGGSAALVNVGARYALSNETAMPLSLLQLPRQASS